MHLAAVSSLNTEKYLFGIIKRVILNNSYPDNMHKILLFLFTFSIICPDTFSQVEFGNKKYPYGIKPASAQAEYARSEYEQWKKDFVTAENAGGYQRVVYDQSNSFAYTASEGIGYGMLLSAYINDRILFDQLFGFFSIHKNKRGLMCWKIPADGITPKDRTGEYNCATDGDQDIAMALLIADIQWGSKGKVLYKKEAVRLLDSLYRYCVIPQTGILKPGDTYGGSDCLNPSYFALSYYPVFAKATSTSGWLKVHTKSLEILQAASALTTTGLIGDWTDEKGEIPSGCTWRPADYGYDACRIPWRTGLDYLWNGNKDAQLIDEKICKWIAASHFSENEMPVTDGYYKNGTQKSPYKNNPVIAGFQTAAMTTNHQALLDKLYNQNISRTDNWFYNRTQKVISVFIATGNFWSPEKYLK